MAADGSGGDDVAFFIDQDLDVHCAGCSDYSGCGRIYGLRKARGSAVQYASGDRSAAFHRRRCRFVRSFVITADDCVLIRVSRALHNRVLQVDRADVKPADRLTRRSNLIPGRLVFEDRHRCPTNDPAHDATGRARRLPQIRPSGRDSRLLSRCGPGEEKDEKE